MAAAKRYTLIERLRIHRRAKALLARTPEWEKSKHPRDEDGKWTGSGAVPRTPDDIDPAKMVKLPTLYRGSGVGQAGNLNVADGDIGRGVYLTPNRKIAESYGGGPTASVSDGTRVVTAYTVPHLYPGDVVYVFGAKRVDDDVSLVSGTGIELWKGTYSPANVERVLAQQDDLKAVIGTPDSVGLNQIAIRDPRRLCGRTRSNSNKR